jgi:hypothetical protein
MSASMKKIKRGSAAAILVALASTITLSPLAVLFARPTGEAQAAKGKLRGIVVELTYARVPKTTIVLENESFKKEVTADEEGAYEVELPAGTYLVKAQSFGFRELLRQMSRRRSTSCSRSCRKSL